jgi:hypothetical protein
VFTLWIWMSSWAVNSSNSSSKFISTNNNKGT